ncbi:MAG: hypothetical protein JO139_11605 [Alphaproteobacteria bacterium]|nr:hypothetical protein [Alphaproteobacteria bacterium]
MVLFAGKGKCQIDRVVGPFGDDAEKFGVNLVAHRVTKDRLAVLAR